MKTKHHKQKAAKAETNKPTLVAFLLDRTGSMDQCRDETIKGFNGYLDELKKQKLGDLRFTLTQFDSIAVEVIHNAVPLAQVKRLTEETYEPRANTPLYDAIGRTIRETEKAAGDKYKVLFVTLTDGEENASSEWTDASVKALIKEKEDKAKWTFAYIGVGLNGFTATQRVAAGTMSASNVMRSSHKGTKRAYSRFAAATALYAHNVGASAAPVACVWAGTGTPDEEDAQ